MALPKDAVSVEGTRLNKKSMTLINSSEPNLQSTKYFKKNVFLSALLMSNLFVAEQAFALSVQPIQVKSALGEPFRAQLVISDIAGVNPATIHASLANDDEFIQLGINKRNLANNLHFSTTITSPERGIITVTSDRPLTDPYIEFVVHIGFGKNVRLQQVTALVDPPLTRIQTETLNLPVKQIQLAEASSVATPAVAVQPATTTHNPNVVKVTSTVTSRTVQLIPSMDVPPPMADETPIAKSTPATPSAVTPSTPKLITQQPSAPAPAPAPSIVNTPTAPVIATPPAAEVPIQEAAPVQAAAPAQPLPTPTTQAPVTPPASTAASVSETPAQPAQVDNKKSYTVQRHDSLWAIASRMQKDMNIPVTVIMHSIQQNNRTAFIRGNPNHIRSGATIVLPSQQNVAQSVQPSLQPIKVENDDVESNKTPTIRSQNQQSTEAKTPYVRRGHLPDAKMTLVAPTQEGSAQGTASEGESDAKQRQLSEINLKITTARQQNMSLSQEVSELEAQIKVNDQKLALQNAKLAELMQRLKNRKDAASQNANRTQNHE